MNEETPMKEGNLKIWWMPQVGAPIPTFYWNVKNIDEAKTLLDCLAQYDLFQLKHRIKPDFSNAGGLVMCEKNPETNELEWVDWMDEHGDDLDEHFRNLEEDQGPEFDSAGFSIEDRNG